MIKSLDVTSATNNIQIVNNILSKVLVLVKKKPIEKIISIIEAIKKYLNIISVPTFKATTNEQPANSTHIK